MKRSQRFKLTIFLTRSLFITCVLFSAKSIAAAELPGKVASGKYQILSNTSVEKPLVSFLIEIPKSQRTQYPNLASFNNLEAVLENGQHARVTISNIVTVDEKGFPIEVEGEFFHSGVVEGTNVNYGIHYFDLVKTSAPIAQSAFVLPLDIKKMWQSPFKGMFIVGEYLGTVYASAPLEERFEIIKGGNLTQKVEVKGTGLMRPVIVTPQAQVPALPHLFVAEVYMEIVSGQPLAKVSVVITNGAGLENPGKEFFRLGPQFYNKLSICTAQGFEPFPATGPLQPMASSGPTVSWQNAAYGKMSCADLHQAYPDGKLHYLRDGRGNVYDVALKSPSLKASSMDPLKMPFGLLTDGPFSCVDGPQDAEVSECGVGKIPNISTLPGNPSFAWIMQSTDANAGWVLDKDDPVIANIIDGNLIPNPADGNQQSTTGGLDYDQKQAMYWRVSANLKNLLALDEITKGQAARIPRYFRMDNALGLIEQRHFELDLNNGGTWGWSTKANLCRVYDTEYKENCQSTWGAIHPNALAAYNYVINHQLAPDDLDLEKAMDPHNPGHTLRWTFRALAENKNTTWARVFLGTLADLSAAEYAYQTKDTSNPNPLDPAACYNDSLCDQMRDTMLNEEHVGVYDQARRMAGAMLNVAAGRAYARGDVKLDAHLKEWYEKVAEMLYASQFHKGVNHLLFKLYGGDFPATTKVWQEAEVQYGLNAGLAFGFSGNLATNTFYQKIKYVRDTHGPSLWGPMGFGFDMAPLAYDLTAVAVAPAQSFTDVLAEPFSLTSPGSYKQYHYEPGVIFAAKTNNQEVLNFMSSLKGFDPFNPDVTAYNNDFMNYWNHAAGNLKSITAAIVRAGY